MTTSIFSRTPGFRPVEDFMQPRERESAPRPPAWRVETLDRDAATTLDPLFPSVVPLWAAGTEPLVLRVGDVDVVRLHPVDAGTAADGELTLEVLELLVEQHGFDDKGEDAGGAWVEQGRAEMALAMPGRLLRGGLPHWRGEDEQRLRQAEAVGRSFGMTGEEVAEVTGRALVPRRVMLEPMGRARELERQRAEAEEAAVRAEAAAAVVDTEALRPRTWRELGAQAVRVARERFGTVGESEPFCGAVRVARDEKTLTYAWRVLPGLALPVFAEQEIATVDLDEVAPLLDRPLAEIDGNACRFLRMARARHMRIDSGPIAREAFGERGLGGGGGGVV
jgi:hypothetical protein